MNCKKCQYMQRITRNSKARCMSHGLEVLLRRFEKQQIAIAKAELRELRKMK